MSYGMWHYFIVGLLALIWGIGLITLVFVGSWVMALGWDSFQRRVLGMKDEDEWHR